MTFVTPARQADLIEAAVVLADAFQGDPPTKGLIPPGVSGRRRRLVALYRALMNSGPLASGTVDVARDPESGRIVGVAIWHGPQQKSVDVLHYVRQVGGFVGAFGVGGLGRGMAAAHACERHRPTAPHWYLQAVGVRRSMHGNGIGSQLLRHRLGIADSAGEAAYLESSTDINSVLYRRHGFVALGPVTGFPGDNPPTSMWRAPRALDPQGLGPQAR